MTKVLQLISARVGNEGVPLFSQEIIDHTLARTIIQANHAKAVTLGYTSTIDPATGSSTPKGPNWVQYVTTTDPPFITVRQHFTPAGLHYQNPFPPFTGQHQYAGTPPSTDNTFPPSPVFAPIVPPAVIDNRTEIIAVFGQSNADGSGAGRYTGQVPNAGPGTAPGTGAGCYCWANDINTWFTLSDPIGGGNGAKGFDAGPWARLGARALGLVNPDRPTAGAMDKVIVHSGAAGGTYIEHWANPTLFGGYSNSLQSFSTGNKDFVMATDPAGTPFPAGNFWMFPKSRQQIIKRRSDPAATMLAEVVSYNDATRTVTLNVKSFTGAGAFSDWEIRPPGAGVGYNNARNALLNMINHGITPRVVCFAHGEAATGGPNDTWNDAAVWGLWEGHGTVDFIQMCQSVIPAIIVYVAKTTLCAGRGGITQADIDAKAAIFPDKIMQAVRGIYTVRNSIWNIVDGNTVRRGPDTDWIGPSERIDGCHISDRGLDQSARLWSLAMYGADQIINAPPP